MKLSHYAYELTDFNNNMRMCCVIYTTCIVIGTYKEHANYHTVLLLLVQCGWRGREQTPEVCRYTHLVWETSVHTVLHEYAASMYNNDVRARDEWLLRLEVPICVSILGGYPDTVQKLSTSGHNNVLYYFYFLSSYQ